MGIIWGLLSAVVLLSGCAGVAAPTEPAAGRPPAPLVSEAKTPPLVSTPADTPPAAMVDVALLRSTLAAEQEQLSRRLTVVEDELRAWRALDEQLRGLAAAERRPAGWSACLAQLQEVAAGYRQSGELLAATERPAAWPGEMVRRLGEDYRRELGWAGSNCRETRRLAELTAAADLAAYQATLAEQMEAAVGRYLEAAKFEDAIRVLRNLEVVYPERTVASPLLSKIALALFRQGKTEAALQLLTRGGPAGKEAGRERLTRTRADILLLAGRAVEARRLYEELAAGQAARREEGQWVAEQLALVRGEIPSSESERRLFLGVLRDVLLFDGQRLPPALRAGVARLERDFPAAPLTERARRLEAGVGREAAAWLEQQQLKVDQLLAEKEYTAAAARLEKILGGSLPPENRRQVQEVMEAALVAKEQAERERQLREQQTLAAQWEEAVRLQGLRKYDEAISAFGKLLDGPHGDEARQRGKETALAAATELRREAASLFVRSRRATEVKQKQETAVASWRLLRRIVERYPDNELIPRVMENLRSLEEYLAELSPGLLEELTGSGQKGP